MKFGYFCFLLVGWTSWDLLACSLVSKRVHSCSIIGWACMRKWVYMSKVGVYTTPLKLLSPPSSPSQESVSLVDFTPHVIQPEFMPTNGSHILLQFRSVTLAPKLYTGKPPITMPPGTALLYPLHTVAPGPSLWTLLYSQWVTYSWRSQLRSWIMHYKCLVFHHCR